MKKTITIIVMNLFALVIHAQGGTKFEKIEKEIVGSSKLTVYYAIEANTGKKVKTGQTVLQILGAKSKYVDVTEDQYITYNNTNVGKIADHHTFAESLKINRNYAYNGVIFKDFSTSTLLVQELVALTTYQYQEPIPKINWKIVKDTKEILGHSCQKATTTFRGRLYTAWFAEDIPISDGPHLFTGLPGLILEISDAKKDYRFTATGIETKNEEVYLVINPAIVKVSRADYQKANKNFHIDPGAALQGKVYSEPGKVYQTSGAKSWPYNPMELE
ncbi:GLPGLI family protein [Myroides sp. NP-2]|nr:GLPGLI family protein [Myroides sp. NP-2]